MNAPTEAILLREAQEAASRGEWQAVYDALAQVDARGPLTGPDLVLLADAAYASGRLDVAIEAWERLYAHSVQAGELQSAAGAAVRIAMHLLLDTALMAPVRGWLRRAEGLLGSGDETPVHAWLGVVRSYERMLAGDLQTARECAHRAVEVGSICEPAAAAVGRVAEARGLILAGEVGTGLALLDEAGVAAVSGELDPLATGVVYCELVCALQGLAQYDMAEQWTEAMERWRWENGVGSIHGRCRVHRAEILRLRGSCVEAESEALRACEELRPYLGRELGWPLTELGRIRLQNGDLAGAEKAFLAAHQAGWDPQPGLALLRLAQGDVDRAVASIQDALDHPSPVPSKERPPNSELRRAPLLAAQVEISVAAGDLDRARWAAHELRLVAARFESKALAASAAFANGTAVLAGGDPAAAQRHFEKAAQLWNEVGAPYERDRARMRVADAQAEVGAVPERVLREGLSATTRPLSSELNEFRREGDYWSVTFEGRTVHVKDLKGMHYLARLLADPGREFHVVDLVLAASGGAVPAQRSAPGESGLSQPGDAGEVLDARAKKAYRRRLAEIDEDIEDARAAGDGEREAQAEIERDFLLRELSRAVGISGRDRRAGSASERARVSVTRAVRKALSRIREHHPPLAEHLDRAIRTGTYCAYLPDPRAPVGWRL